MTIDEITMDGLKPGEADQQSQDEWDAIYENMEKGLKDKKTRDKIAAEKLEQGWKNRWYNILSRSWPKLDRHYSGKGRKNLHQRKTER